MEERETPTASGGSTVHQRGFVYTPDHSRANLQSAVAHPPTRFVSASNNGRSQRHLAPRVHVECPTLLRKHTETQADTNPSWAPGMTTMFSFGCARREMEPIPHSALDQASRSSQYGESRKSRKMPMGRWATRREAYSTDGCSSRSTGLVSGSRQSFCPQSRNAPWKNVDIFLVTPIHASDRNRLGHRTTEPTAGLARGRRSDSRRRRSRRTRGHVPDR